MYDHKDTVVMQWSTFPVDEVISEVNVLIQLVKIKSKNERERTVHLHLHT